MSNQDRLLSDEEWKEHLQGLIMDAAIDYSNNGHRNFYEDAEIALNLINTQKRLYAESVIGEDEEMHAITPSLPNVEMVNMVREENYLKKNRNELRAEQRKRINDTK